MFQTRGIRPNLRKCIFDFQSEPSEFRDRISYYFFSHLEGLRHTRNALKPRNRIGSNRSARSPFGGIGKAELGTRRAQTRDPAGTPATRLRLVTRQCNCAWRPRSQQWRSSLCSSCSCFLALLPSHRHTQDCISRLLDTAVECLPTHFRPPASSAALALQRCSFSDMETSPAVYSFPIRGRLAGAW